MTDVLIGVDPGASGGLAAMTTSPNGGIITAIKMCPTERDIWDWFAKWRTPNCKAIIEKVHSMPGQGVSSTFKFGVGYGGLRMALIGNGIPFEAVSPATWQRAMGLTSPKGTAKTVHKNKLKARAQELFPSIKVTLATADALLLAEYARQTSKLLVDRV